MGQAYEAKGDFRTAYQHYQQAAADNHWPAVTQCAFFLEKGKGRSKNLDLAKEKYKEAVKHNYLRAFVKLALFYDKPKGDIDHKAVQLLEKAIDLGSVEAAYELAGMYLDFDDGVEETRLKGPLACHSRHKYE